MVGGNLSPRGRKGTDRGSQRENDTTRPDGGNGGILRTTVVPVRKKWRNQNPRRWRADRKRGRQRVNKSNRLILRRGRQKRKNKKKVRGKFNSQEKGNQESDKKFEGDSVRARITT